MLNPHNHYWQIRDDESRLWSTASAGWVMQADPVYQTWVAAGGQTTAIASLEDLDGVISDFRADTYRRDTDHLAFKVLRGEATQADYLAAVQRVKDKWPKPSETA